MHNKYLKVYFTFCRCDIQQLSRKNNKVIIEYEFATYKNKEGDRLSEDKTAHTEDKDESPSSKKGIAGQLFGKVVSGVKTAHKYTIGRVFSKAEHHHLVIKRTHSCQINVSNKGIDGKGNLRQSLSTTRLIKHVDIDKCDSISISIKPRNCRLAKAYLFVRFDIV